MSGTSADGIDAVAVRISWSTELPRVELREHKAVPFTEHQREQILRAVSGAATVPELAMLHGTLGDLYAEVAMGLVGDTARMSSGSMARPSRTCRRRE